MLTKKQKEKLEEDYQKAKTPFDKDIKATIWKIDHDNHVFKSIGILKHLLEESKELETAPTYINELNKQINTLGNFIRTHAKRQLALRSKLDRLKRDADEYKK